MIYIVSIHFCDYVDTLRAIVYNRASSLFLKLLDYTLLGNIFTVHNEIVYFKSISILKDM